MLKVHLLGQFSLVTPQGEATLPTAKVRLLAAYLFWKQGEWIRRERLRGMFWGEADEVHAACSLRTALKNLRQTLVKHGLPSRIVESQQGKLRVVVAPEIWVDARTFEENARAGLQAQEETTELVRASALYRGDFLEGMDEEWCLVERERLAVLHSAVLRVLVERLTTGGQYESALTYVYKWLAADPLDESGHQALMRLYGLLGQPARVAEHFEYCRRLLKKELGVAPSDTTLMLYRELGLGAAKGGRGRVLRLGGGRRKRVRVVEQFSGEPLRNARMLLVYGQAMTARGDDLVGRVALEKALKIYERFGNRAEQAKARLVLSERLLGPIPLGAQADAAFRYIEPVLEYYRAYGPPHETVRALSAAAEACWLQGRHQQAIALAREGLEMTAALNDREREAQLAMILGLGLRQGGVLGEARAVFERAVAAVPYLTDAREIVWLLLQRGILSCQIGELDAAESFLREVLSVSRLIDSPWPRVRLVKAAARSRLLFVLHYQDRQPELSEMLHSPEVESDPEPFSHLNVLYQFVADRRPVLEDVVGWLRSSLDSIPPPLQIHIIRRVVEEMLEEGMYVEAARWAAVGIRLARARGWGRCTALLYCHRGAALVRQGRIEAAEVCRRRAAMTADQANMWVPAWLARVDGLIAQARGDHEAAGSFLSLSRRLFGRLGDRHDAQLVKIEMRVDAAVPASSPRH